MTKTYEEYEEEYDNAVSCIRKILASTRTPSALEKADRQLSEAKNCAHALQALAEVDGDPLKIQGAKQRLIQEIGPLSKEISSSIKLSSREILFGSQDVQSNFNSLSNDADSETSRFLLESEKLMKESQSLCNESEIIGMRTLQTMSRQREQLQISQEHITSTISYADRAGEIMRDMKNRALRSKIFLYFVIAALIVANFIALRHVFNK